MTIDAFQRKYHDFSTPDRAEAEEEAARANREGLEGDRKAVVVGFGGLYCLMLDTVASFVGELFGEAEAVVGPSCPSCGEDEPKSLAFLDTYADTGAWRCLACGHTFQTRPRAREE